MITAVEVTERVEEPAIDVAPQPEKLEGSVLVGESIVVGPLPGTPGVPDSANDKPEFDGECVEGNHGATVSSVAAEKEPGREHGEAVAAAAQSDCGKDSASKDDDSLSDDDDSPSKDENSSDDDDSPSEDKSPSDAQKPSAPTTPADDNAKKKDDDDGDGD